MRVTFLTSCLLSIAVVGNVSGQDQPATPQAVNPLGGGGNPPVELPNGDTPAEAREEDLDLQLRRETPFPVEDPAWLEDPFTVLEMEMLDAVVDLAGGKTKPPAKVTQPRIISRLDLMIEQLEKQCNKSGSGSSNNPTSPATASVLRKAGERNGELRATDENVRKWSKLSPKDREKVLESRTDGFPPGYEDVLADYFRSLSRTETPAATETTED